MNDVCISQEIKHAEICLVHTCTHTHIHWGTSCSGDRIPRGTQGPCSLLHSHPALRWLRSPNHARGMWHLFLVFVRKKNRYRRNSGAAQQEPESFAPYSKKIWLLMAKAQERRSWSRAVNSQTIVGFTKWYTSAAHEIHKIIWQHQHASQKLKVAKVCQEFSVGD